MLAGSLTKFPHLSGPQCPCLQSQIERSVTLVGLLGRLKGNVIVKHLAQHSAHGNPEQYPECLSFPFNAILHASGLGPYHTSSRKPSLNTMSHSHMWLWGTSRLAQLCSVLGDLFPQRAYESFGAGVVCISPPSQEPPALGWEHNGC